MASAPPVRYFTPAEMLALADRIEAAACAGRNVRLLPETAYLVHSALRMFATAPTHDDFLKAMCRKRREGRCDGTSQTGCGVTCIGLANAAHDVAYGVRPLPDV